MMRNYKAFRQFEEEMRISQVKSRQQRSPQGRGKSFQEGTEIQSSLGKVLNYLKGIKAQLF